MIILSLFPHIPSHLSPSPISLLCVCLLHRFFHVGINRVTSTQESQGTENYPLSFQHPCQFPIFTLTAPLCMSFRPITEAEESDRVIDTHPEIHTVDDRPFPKEWLKERQITAIHCMALIKRKKKKDERRLMYYQHKYKVVELLAIVFIYNKISMA